MQYFCYSAAPDNFPFLLLLCSSPEVAEHPWAAGGGLSWETSRGDWQQWGFEIPSLEEAPLKASCAHSLWAPCRLPRFLVTRKSDENSSQVLPSPLESHCLVLKSRWTSTSWHFPSSKEKQYIIYRIYRTPCISALRTFSNKTIKNRGKIPTDKIRPGCECCCPETISHTWELSSHERQLHLSAGNAFCHCSMSVRYLRPHYGCFNIIASDSK